MSMIQRSRKSAILTLLVTLIAGAGALMGMDRADPTADGPTLNQLEVMIAQPDAEEAQHVQEERLGNP